MSTYLNFWNIQRSVFKTNGGDNEFFRTPHLDALMKRISYFCEHGEPLILVTAKHGMGKSLLAEKLQTELPVETVDVTETNLHAPVQDSGWLIAKLAKFFNQPLKGTSAEDEQAIAETLLRCFSDLNQENRKLLILIDDAHFIQAGRSLSDLDLLMRMHSRARQCFSVVLLAEPEFEERLNNTTLGEYLTFKASLLSWGRTDIEEFIRYRSRIAGLGGDVFLPEALGIIERASGGSPARVATILEHCLMEAFIQATKVVNDTVAIQAASYLKRQDHSEPMVIVDEAPVQVPTPTPARISFADLMRKKV